MTPQPSSKKQKLIQKQKRRSSPQPQPLPDMSDEGKAQRARDARAIRKQKRIKDSMKIVELGCARKTKREINFSTQRKYENIQVNEN